MSKRQASPIEEWQRRERMYDRIDAALTIVEGFFIGLFALGLVAWLVIIFDR